MTTTTTVTETDVIDFWRNAGPRRWFASDAVFDAEFRARCLDAHLAAANRALDAWSGAAAGSLALLILLDQLPRNVFRHNAHSLATDPLARLFARRALAAGHDQDIEPALRQFCYLPFMHSEDAADQALSLQLYRALGGDAVRHAQQHHDTVLRFGRFPHRNAMLGRDSAADEVAFLKHGRFGGGA